MKNAIKTLAQGKCAAGSAAGAGGIRRRTRCAATSAHLHACTAHTYTRTRTACPGVGCAARVSPAMGQRPNVQRSPASSSPAERPMPPLLFPCFPWGSGSTFGDDRKVKESRGANFLKAIPKAPYCTHTVPYSTVVHQSISFAVPPTRRSLIRLRRNNALAVVCAEFYHRLQLRCDPFIRIEPCHPCLHLIAQQPVLADDVL